MNKFKKNHLLGASFNRSRKLHLILLVFLTVTGSVFSQKNRSFEEFVDEDCKCYNRKKEGFTSKVDAHCHFRPFGGRVIPFTELVSYFQRSGVLFVNAYGIGQTLPSNDTCTYYLDCPGTPVTPSLRNDFVNAANYLEYKGKDKGKPDDPFEGEGRINLVLSMTFPDLAHPERVTEYIQLLDDEYPGVFSWMGEVNLVKQALLENGHEVSTLESIKLWAPFMDTIRRRNVPICIHSDIGSNDSLTEFLYLMEEVLNRYNDNKIVWAHMGLSKELSKMPAEQHIGILSNLLDKHENLTLDLSWDVLWDSVFVNDIARAKYVEFIDAYPTRFITGTDFVASREAKCYKTYKDALVKTSYINRDMSDEAFRNIALGENYFKLLNLDYTAPQICEKKGRSKKKQKVVKE
ncbi:MAG: amidohydrolase [Fluviicola sp.]|nr:MAG: amidohydrolase [Fluviicola sp.]